MPAWEDILSRDGKAVWQTPYRLRGNQADAEECVQDAFLAAHPDLYERSHGAVRVRIERGELALASLACAGYASRALPDWTSMKEMAWASVS